MTGQLYKAIPALCALIFSVLLPAQAEVEVPVATDLQADGSLAADRRLPILLAFSAIACDYCELLEEEFLQPMLLGGEYEDRIIIRKIVLDDGSRLTDFSGQRRFATSLSGHYRVFVTPTLLFVDSTGAELTGRMLGINTPELFGGYLDDCIDTALMKVRGIDKGKWPSTCLAGAQH
jgi:thioredoxin-related protein